nr:TIGR01440 family protein [Vulcanibacillus modesticaldus]
MHDKIKTQVEIALVDLLKAFPMDERHILVIGVSTSEILGQHIGSAGSEDVAKQIYSAIIEAKKKYNFHIAFQGCEHINRALTVERKTAEKFGLEIVTVVPVRKAGGAMAAYAYRQMDDPVVVEFIKADAGIDIGDTFIGMHLKHVAVPVRSSIKQIGEAHLTMAKTRPKLIGGIRAQYTI